MFEKRVDFIWTYNGYRQGTGIFYRLGTTLTLLKGTLLGSICASFCHKTPRIKPSHLIAYVHISFTASRSQSLNAIPRFNNFLSLNTSLFLFLSIFFIWSVWLYVDKYSYIVHLFLIVFIPYKHKQIRKELFHSNLKNLNMYKGGIKVQACKMNDMRVSVTYQCYINVRITKG